MVKFVPGSEYALPPARRRQAIPPSSVLTIAPIAVDKIQGPSIITSVLSGAILLGSVAVAAGVQKTYVAKSSDLDPAWWLVDADQRVLGRLATRIATILMGKDKPAYTPHVDCGDYVIVINAEKIQVTGRKRENKIYTHYTGWVGGLRQETFASLIKRRPEQVIRLAVRRMLPKSRLGKQMFKKLKVYAGPEHEHAAQKPQPREL